MSDQQNLHQYGEAIHLEIAMKEVHCAMTEAVDAGADSDYVTRLRAIWHELAEYSYEAHRQVFNNLEKECRPTWKHERMKDIASGE